MADIDKKDLSHHPSSTPSIDRAKQHRERHSHDAFISYSRRDKAFAQRLERALRAYKPPRGLGVPQRHLRIFRDEEDFTGADYYPAVAEHLKNSAKLLVICSPNARASPYVNDEIACFSQLNGAENIVPILLSGVPNNEAKPEKEGDLAFPRALCDVLQMPLAANYRDFDLKKDKVNRGRFQGPWYSVLANLFDVSRSDVEQRDQKRQLRLQRLVATVGGTVIVILATALVFAITARNEAVRQQEAAISGKLVIDSRMGSSADLNVPLLLALEGLDFAPSEARVRLLEGLAARAPLVIYLPGIPDAVWEVAFSPDSKTLASVSKAGTVILWDVQSEKPIGEPLGMTLWGEEAAVSGVVFSPDGKTIASVGKSGRIHLWDVASRKRIGSSFIGHPSAISSIAFSPDGKVLALGSFDATVTLWGLATYGPVSETLEGHTGAV